MAFINWFEPLESCKTFDQIQAQLPLLMESHHLCMGDESLLFRDAVLYFLACSSLPANLKFATVLYIAGDLEIELRLAYGLLDAELDLYFSDWPVPAWQGAAWGPKLDVPTKEPMLMGYLNGRLAALRMNWRRIEASDSDMQMWAQRFWGEFLETAVRWADIEGTKLALSKGADVAYRKFAPLRAAAVGTYAHFTGEWYYTEGKSEAQYQELFELLLGETWEVQDALDNALEAASAACHIDRLEDLLKQGANIHANQEAALLAAAGQAHLAAVERLLQLGASPSASNQAAIMAAIEALSTECVELLLAHGATLHQNGREALARTVSAEPYHLYSIENDLVSLRADMVLLLAQHGLNLAEDGIATVIKKASRSGQLIAELLGRNDLPVNARQALAVLGEEEKSSRKC